MAEVAALRQTISSDSGPRKARAIKRLKVINAFVATGNSPASMVLTKIPVIPPDLRPMVQLDGGRFATSDLNDLYRRVIERSSDLPRLVGNTKPGTKASIEVWRAGADRTLDVVVGEVPNEQARGAGGKGGAEQQAPAKANWLGIMTSDLTAEQRKSQGQPRDGVVISGLEPNGAAAQAGLRQGDVLLQVNSQPITSASQFEQLLAKLDRKRTLVLLVKRGGEASYVPVRPQ